MDHVRPLIVLAAAALAGTGCAHYRSATATLKQASAYLDPPAPATQFVCYWERELAALPDPSRDGTQTPGLPGKMFFLGADGKPVDVAGDVTIAVYDETPRPPGVPPRNTEVWNYTRDSVARLATGDERFGKCFAVFVPWPAEFADVTTVCIKARYDVPGQPTLTCSDTKLTLERGRGNPVWTDAGAVRAGGFDTRSVPNPAKMIEQVQARQPAVAPPAVFPAASPILMPGRVGP